MHQTEKYEKMYHRSFNDNYYLECHNIFPVSQRFEFENVPIHIMQKDQNGYLSWKCDWGMEQNESNDNILKMNKS